MSEVKKVFSVARLVIGNEPFTLDAFSEIPESDTQNMIIDDEITKTTLIKFNQLNRRFASVYFASGDLNPHPEQVFNTQTRQDEDNPRANNQIERNEQLFVIIDVEEQGIYFSNFKQKSMIERWLNEHLNINTYIKNIIAKERFLEGLTTLDEIKISAVPNLLTGVGVLGDTIRSDIHNYGEDIKQIGLTIKFNENTLSDNVINLARRLIGQNESGEITKLQVSGKHDGKFERVFNTEGVIDKINIEVPIGENGLFEPLQVFETLTNKIQSE